MKILVLYATMEGQTAKIAEHLADALRNEKHQVTTQPTEHLPVNFNLDAFDAVMIGGSIHMSRYPGYLKKFASQHCDWLNNVPSAFFTVCMGINSQDEKSRKQAIAYGEHFIKETDWQPALTATFAGAVKYTQYNFLTRFIMKMISKHEGVSTDTSRDHEYTDWDAVTRFAEQFSKKIMEPQKA